MWKCKKCSEISEDSFDSCWKCGTGKDGTAAPEEFSAAAEEVSSVGGVALESEDASAPQSPKSQSKRNAARSSNDLNRVVKVQYQLFGSVAMDTSVLLAKAIAKENANGWKVIQVIPDDMSDTTLTEQILRLITLGFYKKQNIYILILGR